MQIAQKIQQEKNDGKIEKRKVFFLDSDPDQRCVLCGHYFKSENDKYFIPLMHLLYMP